MKKKKGKAGKFLLVLFVAAAGAAAFLIKKNYDQKKQANAGASQQRVALVSRGNLVSSLSSSGTLSPKDTYSITSLVEGEVVMADFEEGDLVEEGQVLYQIDVSSMVSEVNSANNSLERANNSYQRAVADYEEAITKYSGNTYKSSRAGFIKTLNIEPGDKVSSNTDLAEIYNDQTMKVKASFLSNEAAAIAAGQTAVMTLEDTDEQIEATVTAVSNMDEVLGNGRLVRNVTMEVANPGGLTSERTASVRIGEFLSATEAVFEPSTDSIMKAEISGNGSLEVEALLVNEGDYVTQGTPIFSIKASDVEDILQDFKDSVESAQEKVESAQSKVDSTQDDYDNYTITAPISGQVITKEIKVGDNISRSSGSSSTTMAVIYDLSELTFEMSIDELDIRDIALGQKVEVEADAIEGTVFSGTVTNISLESSQSNGVTNYPVTVTIHEFGDLLPGMNVDGTIILDEADDVLMIPVDSLMRGNRVYVRDSTVTQAQGNVPAGFRSVDVETGLTNEEYVQIISGLSEGDEVYVDESSNTESMQFPMGGMPGGQGGGMPGGGQGGERNGGGRNGGGQGGGGQRP